MSLLEVMLPAAVGCLGLSIGILVEDTRGGWIDPLALVIYSATPLVVLGVAVGVMA